MRRALIIQEETYRVPMMAPYYDPRLLARGRAGVPEREHHGRDPRHGETDGDVAQGHHRHAPSTFNGHDDGAERLLRSDPG